MTKNRIKFSDIFLEEINKYSNSFCTGIINEIKNELTDIAVSAIAKFYTSWSPTLYNRHYPEWPTKNGTSFNIKPGETSYESMASKIVVAKIYDDSVLIKRMYVAEPRICMNISEVVDTIEEMEREGLKGEYCKRILESIVGEGGVRSYTIKNSRTNEIPYRTGEKHIYERVSKYVEGVKNRNGNARDGIQTKKHSLDIDTTSNDWEWDFFVNSEASSILEKGAEALKGKTVDSKKIRGMATRLRNEYGSKYNVNTFAENLEKVFAYIQTHNHVNYDDVMDILKDVARPVIDESTDMVGKEEYDSFIADMKPEWPTKNGTSFNSKGL